MAVLENDEQELGPVVVEHLLNLEALVELACTDLGDHSSLSLCHLVSEQHHFSLILPQKDKIPIVADADRVAVVVGLEGIEG